MTVLTDLFEDLRDAQEEMLRKTRGLRFGHMYEGGSTNTAWVPTVDIAERKDAYLVTVELPGVGIDDLEITCQAGVMTIQGERRHADDSAEQTMHRGERHFGPFLRSITLPSNVMADAIDASSQDGLLQITVPKPKEAHAKRIQVHTGMAHTTPAPAALNSDENRNQDRKQSQDQDRNQNRS
jgi:HSP20 family protein